MDIKKKLAVLPQTSGVYLMKDAQGTVLYVGKAVNLKKRVASYFRPSRGPSKTGLLTAKIEDIGVVETQSEAEALILEAGLIKQYLPQFNVSLRDDKSYPYIQITKEEFPRVLIVRPRKEKKILMSPGLKRAEYFGPYVEARLIREALTIIRKIFPYCRCPRFPKKECLDYHLGLCPAPCTGRISPGDYAKTIHNIRLILEGKKDELYGGLKKEMEALVAQKKFEDAAKVRDQIRAIGALYSGSGDVNYFKEAEQLMRAFGLPRLPERIEAFDTSNLMGSQAVGAMVSFLNGKPDKNNYRRFRIRGVEGIDDVKMIAEIVRRRYRRLKKEGKVFPDLIIIDGGKGQLSAALGELRHLDASIPLAAIAKREEEIFLPHKRLPVILRKDSLGLKLVQRVRDEAHRFAVSYHRKLRAKEAFDETSASHGV